MKCPRCGRELSQIQDSHFKYECSKCQIFYRDRRDTMRPQGYFTGEAKRKDGE